MHTNFMTSIPRSSPAILIQQEYLQQRLRQESQNQNNSNLDNPNNKIQVGRQGPIKDVKSLIDDFRQRHPEVVPRRGRRMKNINQNIYSGDNSNAGNSDSNDALVTDRSTELGMLLSKARNDVNSPPSSNDSSHSNSQTMPSLGASKGVTNSTLYGSTTTGKKNFHAQF